ncbi:MAG: T9SS type A sorting domain-containing protein [Bacteroidota bacterium]|nr:T9SS type A sorting domain-containing protein [Bacteroidota bacterium]
MIKYIIYSFFLVLFSVSVFAQEGLKPLTANINYLYGDLKQNSNKQASQINYSNKATSLTLPFKDDFSYSSTQAYPLQSLWSDSSTYVNSGYAIAPLSIGVATFDGLNKFGYPYTPNLVNMSSSLPADTLTSKPINLAFAPVDSIALTFYYQARGNGDAPEISDSLLLDYYMPKQNKWQKVWYQRGNTSANTNDTIFKRGFVGVTDTAYLHDGFKFRFRNMATTAGNFDHWNLDYVFLDKNRSIIADTNYFDFAFGYVPTPFVKNYSSMPWRQYDTSDMVNKNSVFIRNNGIINGNLTYTNNFYDNTNTKIYGYNGGASPNLGIFKYNGWLNAAPLSNPSYTYNLPSMTAPVVYKIQHILYSSSTDFIQANDTVIQHQTFSNYYAFDDGSAEAGYYVNGTGGKIAAKYKTRVSDTLRAVRIYFDPVGSLNLAQSYAFRINIWQAGSNGPSSVVILRDSVMNPNYYNVGFNTFSEYTLTSPLILPAGTYYIGIQQQVAAGIVIGFDKNINHSSSLYYDSGNGWTQSSIYGSIMIRPVFGAELPLSVNENLKTKENLFFVYPNPSNNILNIKFSSENYQKINSTNSKIQLLNMLGQVVIDENPKSENTVLNTQNLPSGIYFLTLKVNEQLVQQQKIIIQH